MRARPSELRGPVDLPPLKQQRVLPGVTLWLQAPPDRVFAPQTLCYAIAQNCSMGADGGQLRETYTRPFRHKPTLGDYLPVRGETALEIMSAPAGLQLTKRQISALDVFPPLDGIEVVKAETPGGISILRVEIEQKG